MRNLDPLGHAGGQRPKREYLFSASPNAGARRLVRPYPVGDFHLLVVVHVANGQRPRDASTSNCRTSNLH